MIEYDFTQAEKKRVDELGGNDFEGVTSEDIPLLKRWFRYEQASEAEFEAMKQAAYEDAQANLLSAQNARDNAVMKLQSSAAVANDAFEQITANLAKFWEGGIPDGK